MGERLVELNSTLASGPTDCSISQRGRETTKAKSALWKIPASVANPRIMEGLGWKGTTKHPAPRSQHPAPPSYFIEEETKAKEEKHLAKVTEQVVAGLGLQSWCPLVQPPRSHHDAARCGHLRKTRSQHVTWGTQSLVHQHLVSTHPGFTAVQCHPGFGDSPCQFKSQAPLPLKALLKRPVH